MIVKTFIKILPIFFLGFVAIIVFPVLDPSKSGPGIITVGGVGITITLITAAVLYYGVKTDLNLSRQALLYTFIYSSLMVVLKFVLSPLAIYKANELGATGLTPTNGFEVLILGTVIFLIYFALLRLIYIYFKKRLSQEGTGQAKGRSLLNRLLFVTGIGSVLAVIVLSGGVVIFLPLLLLWLFLPGTIPYLFIVLSPPLGLAVALALCGAIGFLTVAFKDTAERTQVINDLSLLAGLFWLVAGFLFIYHALWVVYLFILASIWPLKTVIPGK